MRPSQRTRYRYLLVEFRPAGLPRNELIRRLRGLLPPEDPPWLTRYDGRLGVLRTARGREVELRRRLEALEGPLKAAPLLTSGTIAGLERRHGGRLGSKD